MAIISQVSLYIRCLYLFTVYFEFPGQIGLEWRHEGGRRFEATCNFAVLENREPDTENFIVEFGKQVSEFTVG